MQTKSQLVDGLIPAGQHCPFASKCECAEFCPHERNLKMGAEYTADFSCAIARGFDMIRLFPTQQNKD